MGAGGLLGLLAIAAGGLFYKASSTLSDPVEAPLSPLKGPTAEYGRSLAYDAYARAEQLFSQLGCVSCHAEGARFRAMLKRFTSRTPEEVARWIRNPEATVPGTQMPTYAELIDDAQAMTLAAWV